jgi:hypothetical protein
METLSPKGRVIYDSIMAAAEKQHAQYQQDIAAVVA